jgi:type IV fimbrial biogenesis protein FimT
MTLPNRRQNGVTLPELLIGMAIMSTLSVSGVSQLSLFMSKNRMAAEVNQFMTALHQARNASLTHAGRVVLCPSSDGTNCGNSQEWNNGWILFASNNREHDADEIVLQAGTPLASGINLHASNHRKRILFQQDGSSGGSNSSFTFCDSRGLAAPRVICLSNSGRPRLSRAQCNGRPIQCG